MPVITISGEDIDFPDSGQSPNWAPAIIRFAELVTQSLNSFAGPYDVSKQVISLNNDVNTNVDAPLLDFPTSAVRGAFIRYTVYRKSDTTTSVMAGNLITVYNPDASPGNKWDLTNVFSGQNILTFNITDAGQVQYSTTALGGVYAEGTLTYTALAQENS